MPIKFLSVRSFILPQSMPFCSPSFLASHFFGFKTKILTAYFARSRKNNLIEAMEDHHLVTLSFCVFCILCILLLLGLKEL